MLQLRTAVMEAGGQSGPKSDMLSLRRRHTILDMYKVLSQIIGLT